MTAEIAAGTIAISETWRMGRRGTRARGGKTHPSRGKRS